MEKSGNTLDNFGNILNAPPGSKETGSRMEALVESPEGRVLGEERDGVLGEERDGALGEERGRVLGEERGRVLGEERDGVMGEECDGVIREGSDVEMRSVDLSHDLNGDNDLSCARWADLNEKMKQMRTRFDGLEAHLERMQAKKPGMSEERLQKLITHAIDSGGKFGCSREYIRTFLTEECQFVFNDYMKNRVNRVLRKLCDMKRIEVCGTLFCLAKSQ